MFMLAPSPTDWGLFWAETWRDLIVTVIVGGILAAAVGWALSRWQTRIETAQDRRLALASWAVLRPKVQLAAARGLRPFPVAKPGGHASSENDLRPLLEIAESVHIALWAEAAQDSAELSLLRDLIVAYPPFEIAGHDVLREVESEVLVADTSLLFDPVRLTTTIEQSCGLLGSGSKDDGPHIAVSSYSERMMHVELEDVRKDRATAFLVAQHPRVLARWEAYVDAHNAIYVLHERLRQAIS